MLRHDWSVPEIRAIYTQPFPDLMYQAQKVHRGHFDPAEIQRSTLLSIKTGGCPEDCAYCPQSAHFETGIKKHAVLPLEYVLEKAREAKAEGSTRFCMGAAWREVKDGKEFNAVLQLVRGVHELGMEVCCTLGMLTASQARRLKDAGCHTYNHNLDTSPEFYGNVISTRTYQDRLATLRRIRAAGMKVCCGSIIGMGESLDDRLGLLKELANQDPHPRGGHAPRRRRRRRSHRVCADRGNGMHPHAPVLRAAVGRPCRNDRRGAGVVFPGRRQLDLFGRKTADGQEQ